MVAKTAGCARYNQQVMMNPNRWPHWTLRLALLTLVWSVSFQLQGAAAEDDDLTGMLLVSTPEMPDPRFTETVIYIVKHDKSGTMGLVINRPIAKGPIGDLLKGLGVDSEGARGEIILHYGGPVEAEQAFFLHSDDYLVDGSEIIKDGIAVTTDVAMLRALSLGKGPRLSLFALGYAGWAPGQLEAEIHAGGWFTIPAEKNFIFGGDSEKKWQRAADKRKIPL